MLADNVLMKRISLKEFIEKFYIPAMEGTMKSRVQFLFKMLDKDDDGILHATDLLQA